MVDENQRGALTPETGHFAASLRIAMTRDLSPLKARLQAHADRLLVALLGQPTARGARHWRWGRRGSLSYDFHRHCWHSFETEQGGDLLDLVRFANPGWDFREALRWAHDWIGSPRSIPRPTPRHGARMKALRTADLAMQLWTEARRAEGTLVESYLRQRGLALPENSVDVLRFHPACPRSGDRLPAMLGLMRDIDTDRPAGIHRTFLRHDGRAKADVEPNKMMLGVSRGAVLKLTADEEVTMGLNLSEGIEDGLAVLNRGIAPVWACLSAGAMMNFPVLGGVEALTVFSDADSVGRRASHACVLRWQKAGKDARLVDPPSDLEDFGAIAEGRHYD